MEALDGRLHGGVAGTATCAPSSGRVGLGRGGVRRCSRSSPRRRPRSSSRRWALDAADRTGSTVDGTVRRRTARSAGRVDARRALAVCGAAGRSRSSSCRTGPTTGSTTGRCRSRASRYDLALADRSRDVVPVLHDIFTRMWFDAGRRRRRRARACSSRWRALSIGERLLVLWVGVGALELIVHDVGNERRFVFLIPALVALTAIALGRDRRLLPDESSASPGAGAPGRAAVLCTPPTSSAAPIVRLPFLYEVSPNVRIVGGAGRASAASWSTPRGRGFRARSLPADAGARAARALVAARWPPGTSCSSAQWAVGRTLQELRGVASSSAACCRPGRSCRASSPTACRSRTASGRSSSAAGSATTRTGRRRDDVRYILTYIAPSSATSRRRTIQSSRTCSTPIRTAESS